MFFDSHLHIIDPHYPLYPNNGYLPDTFLAKDYLAALSGHHIMGGAVVSGSFQQFDQDYLVAALQQLGPGFVGVTQLPHSATDAEIHALNDIGVRAVRFNLKRGGSESVDKLAQMAERVFALAGWHVELYVDSNDLAELMPVLIRLPKLSIDHLGLSQAGFADLCKLVEVGCNVKATGFSRGDLDVKKAMRTLYTIRPDALMFGSDLPCTRAPRYFSDEDFALIGETFSDDEQKNVYFQNALNFYGVKPV